mmetsp:Transcript_28942/g.40352  ORF Transcript_28942/g.40352 Transcript_28942/m.40352 type:complete len:357 (+) Transcript_28942:101-1171(+)
MTSQLVPNNSSHWNQQKVLETVRGLKELSLQEKTVLEQMLQNENTKMEDIIKSSATLQDLEHSLVALAKQIADKNSMREEMKTEPDASEAASNAIKLALQKYEENKVSIQTTSLKAILKILQKVEKKPSDNRNRQLKMSNVVVKKFVTKVKGGEQLMAACGYERTEVGDKKTEHLLMKDTDLAVLKVGISLIQEKIKELKSGGGKPAVKRQSTKVLCPCGFWGTTDQDGLCSVCYKKKMFGSPENTKQVEAKSATSAKGSWKPKFKKARIKLKALHRFRLGVKTCSRIIQKNKKRCFECNKKVGILGFECRCMYVFCDLHRFPDSHKCTFDYKRLHQNKLKKDNKVVVHDKISKLD